MKTLYVRLWAVLLIFAVGLFFVSPHPAQSQNPIQILESDDPRVIQSGAWSSQTTPAASNGSYLFNDPSSVGAGLRPAQSPSQDGPLLALAFVGSAIEIIYVDGPQFGTIAIEIDGTVVRTVVTTTEKIEYGQVARVDYLSGEPHNVKIYAQAGGVVAIDAFRISPSPVLERGPGGEVAPAALDDGGIQSSSCAPLNAIHRVSLTSTGDQVTVNSVNPTLSADGRYVAFITGASLVPGDGDVFIDGYVYDRQTCVVELITVSSGGVKGSGVTTGTSISGDGRYVAFSSDVTNLVLGDANGAFDVFVRDRQTATTTRVSVATGGAPTISGHSFSPSISADGRYIAFDSAATNLVASDTNAMSDVFVHDRQTNTTTRVSVATGSTQGTGGDSITPAISADGRYVAFQSNATNLVTGDTNSLSDVFVHDRQTATTTRISVATGGTQATGGSSTNASISADGRYVAFESAATNLVASDTNAMSDVFVHDRQTNTTTRVSVSTAGAQADSNSVRPKLSADGRFVVFESSADNLAAGNPNSAWDIFVRDRQTNTTTLITVSIGGGSTDGNSDFPVISANGRYIAFRSSARDLVTGDSNDVRDIFVASSLRPASDNLTLFQPTYKGVLLLDTLADNPPANNFTYFSAYAPVTGGQWIMGDWNADGLKTPGVYLNGAFHYTNDLHETKTWYSIWLGINGPVVAGRFEVNSDCVGAIDSASFPPFGTAFVLYITCDLTPGTAPALSSQWLSVLLPDSGGFSGTHQFVMGDWNGDGAETIAVRRGAYITWTNDNPFNGSAGFANAQFFGAPGTGSEGQLVDGDWDRNGTDSFGLFYQNGELFYRNDLTFNSGVYTNQSIGVPFAGTVQASTWR